MDKLISDMDKLNLRVMVNLSGGYGDNLKRMWPRKRTAIRTASSSSPTSISPGSTIPDYPARAAAQLEQDVKNGAQGLKIFKNFGMELKDAQGPAHSRRRSALRSGLRGVRPD